MILSDHVVISHAWDSSYLTNWVICSGDEMAKIKPLDNDKCYLIEEKRTNNT